MTGLVQLVVVLAVLGLLYAVNMWVTPLLLSMACRATDCGPRAVAAAGWVTIAGVPVAIGIVVLFGRNADGWRYWLTLVVAMLLAAPGVALLPGHRDSQFLWDGFGAARGLDAYRAGVQWRAWRLPRAGCCTGSAG